MCGFESHHPHQIIMNYILMQKLSEDDIDFINVFDCGTRIVHYSKKQWHLSTGLNAQDSGWCDASTGAYIIKGGDRVIFVRPKAEQETFLKLKYGEALVPLNTESEHYLNGDIEMS